MPEEIKQITNKEGLIMFYNTHLQKYLAQKINAVYFSEMGKNDIVKSIIVPSGNPQLPGTRRDLKAKDALTDATKQRNHQEHILRVISRLIKEEK